MDFNIVPLVYLSSQRGCDNTEVLWIGLVNFIFEIYRLKNLIPPNNIAKGYTYYVALSGDIFIYRLVPFTPVLLGEIIRWI